MYMSSRSDRGRTSRRPEDPLHLVATKLSPPSIGVQILERDRLGAILSGDPSIRLLLLRAPAGFGKTTLMTQCWERFRSQALPCAWLTLDQADNDIRCFIAHLMSSLNQSALVPQRGARLLMGGDHRVPVPTGNLQASVLDRLSNNVQPGVVFFDDMETVSDPEISDFVERLIDLSHPNLRFVIASRSIPKIGLGRLRLRGCLQEIGPEILRFKEGETKSFVLLRLGAKLDEREVCELHKRTEGWPAALQLACLSLEERADPKLFVHSFSGLNGDLAEYLAEDVLERQPENVRDLLLATSLFPRFNGSLCEAVTKQTDSASTLAHLETAGMFLRRIETGDEGGWFQYHSLFSEFLRGQLQLRHPDRVPGIFKAASLWFENKGMMVDAANYARRAGDRLRSVALFESVAMGLIHQGMLNTVISYVEELPQELLAPHPRLHLAYIWALAFERRFETAWGALRKFSAGKTLLESREPEIQDNYLTLESMIPANADDFVTVERRVFAALKQMSRTDTFEYGALANVAGHCRMARGEFDLARETFSAARASHGAAGSLFGFIFSEMLQGVANHSELRLRSASDRLRGAFEQAHGATESCSHSGAVVAGFLAEALYETNDVAGARAALQDYLPFIAESGIPDAVIVSYLTLARIEWLDGKDQEALLLLAKAEGLGFKRALPRVVNTIRWEIARLRFLQGQSAEADRRSNEIDDSELRVRQAELMTPPEALTRDIAPLRLAIWQGRTAGVADRLLRLGHEARRRGFRRRLLKLQLLYAVALSKENDHTGAVNAVAEALWMGLNEGFVRTYLDEGPPVMNLVRAARLRLQTLATPKHAEATIRRWEELVKNAAHDRAASCVALEDGVTVERGHDRNELMEVITGREIEILEFLSKGLSNRDIASQLVISETTVKWHLRNIFAKLQAANRTEAVFSARRRHVIV
jgi:LuxR family maltose regulon positive regulatory protein